MPRPPHWALRYLSFLVIALLLAPLASSTGMEPHCADGEMACLHSKSDDEPIITTAVKNEHYINADVGIEIRGYSKDKDRSLIRLRTKSDSDSIKLVYERSKDAIVGCEKSRNGKGEPIIKFISKDIELLDSKVIPPSGFACEFYYASKFDPLKKIYIVYGKKNSEKVIKGATDQIGMAADEVRQCDPNWLEYDFSDDANWTYTEPDKRFNKLECAKGQELVYERKEENGEVKEVKAAEGGIVCTAKDGPAEDDPKTYSYDIYKTKADKEKYTIDAENSRNVACRALACKQCTKVPCSGPICPEPFDDKDGCKVLKCPEEKAKFLKSSSNDVSTFTSPICQAHKIEGEKTEFRWMDGDKEVTKVECVSTVHCQDVNKLFLNKTDGAKVEGLDPDKNKSGPLKCDKGPIQSGLIQIADKQVKEITCNGQTGEWSADGVGTVAKSSTISCADVPNTASKSKTDASTGSIGEYVLYGVGGLAFIAVICIIIFCVITQRKKAAKRSAAKKIQTIKDTDSKQEPDLNTAKPLYPLPTMTTSDPPKKAEPELVEKTMIAQTPTETKAKSVTMKTAVLAPMSERENGPQQVGEDTLRLVEEEAAHRKKKGKKKKEAKDEKEGSDGSDAKPIKIGKDGAIIEGDQSNAGDRSGDKSGQSEMGTTKKEEPKPKIKPVDSGPKPQVFPLNEKEEKIRMGAVRKPADYPTLADIKSDWDSNKEREKEKKADEERKKRRSSNSRDKTVPTAVTPENPDAKASVDRTQNTKDKTRNTVEKGEDTDILNLLTQMDNTFEQKEADAKKKK